MFGSAVVSQTIVVAAATLDCRAFAGDGALLLWKMMLIETAFCLGGWGCCCSSDSYQFCLCVSENK